MATKQTIAVFSNYDATEKTLCAMYLLKHIQVQRYHHVLWIVPEDITPTHRYAGFSHEWDAGVVSLQSHTKEIQEQLGLYLKDPKRSHVPTCEACFFFEENELLLSFLPNRTKSVMFLDHHKWDTNASNEFIKKCTYILTPSPTVVKAIRQPSLFTDSLLCPFDSAIQLIPRPPITSGQKATLFYPAYGMTFSERQVLKYIAEIVKECCPETKKVVGYYDTNDEPEPGNDARTYDWKLMEYLKHTDWIIDLNPRPLMGLFGSFAGALNIQWSCFDLPPHNDDYSAARRHLIPYPKGGLTLKNAEEIAGRLVRHLTSPFYSEVDRNIAAGAYVKRLKEFYRGLNKVFGVKSR